MPLDYEDGTDYYLVISWTAGATTGDVVWGIGAKAIGNNEDFAQDFVYNTTTVSPAGTTYYKQEVKLLFSGTGVQANDDIQFVVYRDADNIADTMSGDALISTFSMEYLSNRLGE